MDQPQKRQEHLLDGVAKGRPKLGKDRIRELADGRVFGAREALEVGLVDRIGYLDDAIARAKELAGVDDAAVVAYQRPFHHRENIYSSAEDVPAPRADGDRLVPTLRELLRPPRAELLYLWSPGYGGGF